MDYGSECVNTVSFLSCVIAAPQRWMDPQEMLLQNTNNYGEPFLFRLFVYPTYTEPELFKHKREFR